MSIKDVYEIRDRSEAYKAFKAGKVRSAIWVTDEPEMIRKTVIKRHSKYLPKSDKTEKFATAVELDNIANGYYEAVDFNHLGMIEASLRTCTLQPEEIARLEAEIPRIEYKHQATAMMKYINANQIDPRDEYLTTLRETNKAIDKAMQNDE